MRLLLRRRVLPGAPTALVAVVVLAVLAVLAALVIVGAGLGGVPAPLPLPAEPARRGGAAGWTVLGAVAQVVALAGAARVMAWRAGLDDSEDPVWRWFARAAGVLALAALVRAVGGVAAVLGAVVPAGLGPGALCAGVLLACPLLYQGLVRWNRYGTLTAQPGDWLNGLGAVLTLTAIGDLLLPSWRSTLASSSGWLAQPWLVRAGAEIMLLGTVATVLVIGGLRSDVRAWAVTATVTLVVVLDVARLSGLAAVGSLPDAAWALTAAVLAACAVLRSTPPLPRPVVSAAPTAGAIVVLLAAIAVLVLAGVIGHGGGAGAAAAGRWAAVWAGLGALAVTVRGLQLVRVLANLVSVRHEALTDDLTGLSNRRALDRRLAVDLAAGSPLTLMVIDLDGFKQVNDRFGHAVGDALLRQTGVVLRRVAPPGAMTARLGGDEFAVVLPSEDPGTALAVFSELARASAAPVVVEGRRVVVRASTGIAVAAPGEDAEECLRHADAAMYRAKTSGGARVAVHDDAAAQEIEQRVRLVEEIKALLRTPDADEELDAGRLVVHYQPQLAPGGAVVGAEALVRWDNPRLGLLSPDRFLGVVEEYGLMPALTGLVMREAVDRAAAWRGRGHRLRMSVNLSATCLTHPDLPVLVDEVLAESGLDAGDLVLEVTETSIMSDPLESIARLRELAGRGVDVSIDDYGSGYSSLAYLNDLPASELKLDRSLTQQVTASPRTAAIVAGTVALAHRLGLRVVAEGVEDAPMLSALLDLGCDETQGFLHARPMAAADFERWLAARAAGGGVDRARDPGGAVAPVGAGRAGREVAASAGAV